MPIDTVLQGALERLGSAKDEVVLDFSAVRRIDVATLQALEQLAAKAGGNSVRVVLRGVNEAVYKALKLAKITPRLCFEG